MNHESGITIPHPFTQIFKSCLTCIVRDLYDKCYQGIGFLLKTVPKLSFSPEKLKFSTKCQKVVKSGKNNFTLAHPKKDPNDRFHRRISMYS